MFCFPKAYPQCGACGIVRRHGMPPSISGQQSCGASACSNVLGIETEGSHNAHTLFLLRICVLKFFILASSAEQRRPSNIPQSYNDLAHRTMTRFNLNTAPAKNKMPAAQVKQIKDCEQGLKGNSGDYLYTIHWVVCKYWFL
jgi:hypothetical protein